MPVKIRLARQGRKKRPIYHIVAADSRSPRDGKFIERLGLYNPLTVPATIDIDVDKTVAWLEKGAQPTDTCHKILSYKGVLYKKHLLRGVKKGVLAADMVETKFAEFLAAHEGKVAAKKSSHQQKVDATLKTRLAKKAAPVAEVAPEEAPIAETPVAEAPITEAPAADAPAAE